jgi:exodeoxyribonuclease-3
MRVVSWNVNSIRTRADAVAQWIDRHSPDVVLLQETRCSDAQFPYSLFESRGLEVAHHGGGHRNGVAIAGRAGLADVTRGLEGPAPFDEPRMISATTGGIRFHSVYVPNGRALDDPHYAFKLEWLQRLLTTVSSGVGRGEHTVLAGDFNVAPADIDIYDPARWRRRTHASPPERAAIEALQSAGLVDVARELDPRPGVYTWWNYRPGQFERNNGLRIDLVFVDRAHLGDVDRVWVDLEARAAVRPSDHAPVVLELSPRPVVNGVEPAATLRSD